MTDVARDLSRLRELVVSARSMPMSASAVINRAEVLEAIDRISEGWTQATSESSAVVAERERLVAEGEAAAKETIRLAELERDRLVSDTEVFRLATREAEELRASSREEAEQLRRDAEDYIEQRFANFEHALERTLNEVRRGIANLAGRSAFSDDGDAPAPGGGPRTDSGFGPGGQRNGSSGDAADDVLLTGPDAG